MYLLDANTYIQAKNIHYKMEVFPGFWQWIDDQYNSGTVLSVKPVYEEIKSYGDELSQWVSNRKEQFEDVDDDETIALSSEMADYISNHSVFSQTQKERFLGGADLWLIAKARARSAVIITHEVLAPSNSTKVKIPNICKEFNVRVDDIYTLLEKKKAVFIQG